MHKDSRVKNMIPCEIQPSILGRCDHTLTKKNPQLVILMMSFFEIN